MLIDNLSVLLLEELYDVVRRFQYGGDFGTPALWRGGGGRFPHYRRDPRFLSLRQNGPHGSSALVAGLPFFYVPVITSSDSSA